MDPVYDHDGITLYHGDCMDVLATLAEGSIDAIVTSPPYNQLDGRVASKSSGMHKGNGWLAKANDVGYCDDMPETAYRGWLCGVAGRLFRVAKPGGSFFFNHKIRFRDGEMIHPLDYVRDWPGWKLRQEIVWDRCGAFAFNCGLFAPADERIYWLTKPGVPHTWNHGAAAKLSVWRIPSNRHVNSSILGHSCPFPVEIPARSIAATTKPGDTVLDPFAGSGTTGIACLNALRRCILVEREARYIPVIIDRLQAATLDTYLPKP